MIMLILERVSIPFFIAQQDQISEEFQFFDSYDEYIMNYLTKIESESDDVLSHKNTKFIFYQFNQYLAQIGQPLKLKDIL